MRRDGRRQEGRTREGRGKEGERTKERSGEEDKRRERWRVNLKCVKAWLFVIRRPPAKN